MNNQKLISSVSGIGLLVVTALMTNNGIIQAQDYYPAAMPPSRCVGGSCGVTNRPGVATCPNGRCSNGTWFPTFGNIFPMQTGGRQFQNTSRPFYPGAVAPPTVTQASPVQNRESPYYSESDFKPPQTSGTAASSRAYVPEKNNDSPYYE